METEISNPGSTLRVEPLGDQALLVILGEGIDEAVNDRVHRLAAKLRERNLPGVHDLVPAYATLAVHYDVQAWSGLTKTPYEALTVEIQRLWSATQERGPQFSRLVEIPVRYGGEWGPDLGEVAERCHLSEEDVIARHTAPEYRVFMLGFAPGFSYLGGLDATISAPRRETPRLKVPAGSVGIAGLQTGIYPLATPGGWQIIGQTPLRLFRPASEDPCLLRPGDRLKFVAIDEIAFRTLAQEHP